MFFFGKSFGKILFELIAFLELTIDNFPSNEAARSCVASRGCEAIKVS